MIKHNINKLKKFSSVGELLHGFGTESSSDSNKKTDNKMKKTNYKKFLKIIESDKDIIVNDGLIKEIDFPDQLESSSQVAWLFCNKFHKKIPNSYYIDSGKYNTGLLDFFRTNGKLEYKKIYSMDDYPEINYIFSYQECFYTISVNFITQDGEASLYNFSCYHPIHIDPNIEQFSKFLVVKKENPKIGIIKTTRMGPMVSWIEHKNEQKFEEDNYNDDFPVFFKDLTDKLSSKEKTGLYLFYGEAGTGKSSAIRHLINSVDRPVVFIPPQMINCLSNPEFTDLVTNSLKGSILVIEDAEKALMKRESQDGFFNSELVSSILNLTDGLYADLSQTAIIATYNCDRNLIDPALLRKGRLRSEYHFQKLSEERSQKLMDKQGHDVSVEEPMTLADIFNYEKQYSNDDKSKKPKRVVGFGK
jgi:hypothetical protein